MVVVLGSWYLYLSSKYLYLDIRYLYLYWYVVTKYYWSLLAYCRIWLPVRLQANPHQYVATFYEWKNARILSAFENRLRVGFV